MLESADVVIEETVPATMVLPFAAVHESFIVIDNEESVIVLDVGSLKTVFSNSELVPASATAVVEIVHVVAEAVSQDGQATVPAGAI